MIAKSKFTLLIVLIVALIGFCFAQVVSNMKKSGERAFASHDQNYLVGKTKSQVIEIFGNPDQRDQSDLHWRYKDRDFDINGLAALDVYFDPQQETCVRSKYETSAGPF